MDKLTKNKSKYVREISLMKDMMKQNQIGFPRLLYYNADKYNYFIVMDQLGPSLKELREAREDQKFTMKTVTMIGLQLLQRLESIHKFNYVHRDLKPANILVGRNKSDQYLIYLIDFGLAKKQNQVSTLHQGEGGNKVVGTAIYAGVNAHLPGSNYYKKDDVESMMYVLCYLATGTLPWKNCKASDAGLDKMLKMKAKISPYELFEKMPIEYAQIMEHIKNQPQDQNCDYGYMESLLRSVAYKQKFKIDNVFDWLLTKKGKTGEIYRKETNNLDQQEQQQNFQYKTFQQVINQDQNQNQNNQFLHINDAQMDQRNKSQSTNNLQVQNSQMQDNFKGQLNKTHENRNNYENISYLEMPNSSFNISQQNPTYQQDQGGLANLSITHHNPNQQQQIEEEKQPQINQQMKESLNAAQKEEYALRRTKPRKTKDIEKERRERKPRKSRIEKTSPLIPQDKNGKVGLNFTLNIQSPQQQDQQQLMDTNNVGKQGQMVQMTINHNVHLHITGNKPDGPDSQVLQPQIQIIHNSQQFQQASPDNTQNQQLKLKDLSQQECSSIQNDFSSHIMKEQEIKESESDNSSSSSEFEAEGQHNFPMIVEQNVELNLNLVQVQQNIDNNDEIEDFSYEEFEQGINLEYDGIVNQVLDSPKNLSVHSNVSRMKNSFNQSNQ
eukprot:403371036